MQNGNSTSLKRGLNISRLPVPVWHFAVQWDACYWAEEFQWCSSIHYPCQKKNTKMKTLSFRKCHLPLQA